MKTTNIVLIGVVGVGVVGAYMYMKNKKAQDNLLSGSLPTTIPSGTPPLATTPLIPTPNLTEPVKIIGDANLDAYNLQKTLDQLKDLENELKAEPKKVSFTSADKKGYDTWLKWYINIGKPSVYEFRRKPFIDRLASLGYKFDNGLLIKI
jgi:hypothetical protein